MAGAQRPADLWILTGSLRDGPGEVAGGLDLLHVKGYDVSRCSAPSHPDVRRPTDRGLGPVTVANLTA
jgi:hypothetical protein